MSITVSKFKLVKGGESAVTSFTEDGECPAEYDKVICRNRCHPDLINAIQGLRVHLAILTGYIQVKHSHREDLMENFKVSGFAIGGKVGEEGIVIKGRRKGDYGWITLNTNFIRFEQDPATAYSLISDIKRKLDGATKPSQSQPGTEEITEAGITREIIAYLQGGKKGTEQQLSAFPDDEEKPKRNGKVTHMKVAGDGSPDDVISSTVKTFGGK